MLLARTIASPLHHPASRKVLTVPCPVHPRGNRPRVVVSLIWTQTYMHTRMHACVKKYAWTRLLRALLQGFSTSPRDVIMHVSWPDPCTHRSSARTRTCPVSRICSSSQVCTMPALHTSHSLHTAECVSNLVTYFANEKSSAA